MGKSIVDFSSVTRVGVDLAKNVFQVHAVDVRGAILIVRKVRRGALLDFFARLPACVVGITGIPVYGRDNRLMSDATSDDGVYMRAFR